MNDLPSTQAFKIKCFPDGTVKKFKAHSCAPGDPQKEGINFFETWALVVLWSKIQVVMVLTAKLGLHAVQCDITATFIHRHVPPEEEIYIHQLRGFKCGHGTEVLRICCTLYRLPQYFFKYFRELFSSKGLLHPALTHDYL
jgi:hypothetical protein